MTGIKVFEQAVHTRQVAVSVIDGLARALRTAGEFPPPLGEIACHILGQTVPVARTFDPPLILWTFRNHSGFLILDGTYAREGARAPRLPLNAGTYRIRVRGAYYQDTEFSLVWPPPDDEARIPRTQPNKLDNIELLPGGAYPLPDVTTGRFQLGVTILRGSLFMSSGDPIPDVLVEVINLPQFLPQSVLTGGESSALARKGFWRVDKDKDPELRHTVLTLVALQDLEAKTRGAGGDRERGIEAFFTQNDGEGWMLPDTLRLADYGFGHDERAEHPQPVASRLGPRFYDLQHGQTADESWRECAIHADNVVGHRQSMVKEG